VNSGFNVDQERISLGLRQNKEAAKVVFLFFGFIRKYIRKYLGACPTRLQWPFLTNQWAPGFTP